MSKAILVTGATGKQGGSVISALLKANADFEILGLTRNAQSPSAQRLLQKSPKVKLVTGDLDDSDAIFRKTKEVTNLPIWGVYSVQVAIGDGANVQREEKQGKALVDAAVNNGVTHFVYSSVDRGGPKSDKDPTNVPHFASKFAVEQHLFKKSSGTKMTWTVLRPVGFYENLVPGFLGKVFSTSWRVNLKPEKTLQLVATSDIGYFAAEAFLNPAENKNKSISIAGDELTYRQYKNVFEAKTGQTLPTTYGFLAALINWLVKDLGLMFIWFGKVGYEADIPTLKRAYPDLKDFGTWLETESQFKTR